MISLFFLGLLFMTFLWNTYYARHWNQGLSVSLDFVQNSVYAGGQAEMTEKIENRKKLPLPVLEVAFHIDKRLSFLHCENTTVSDFIYKRDIFALLGRQRVTRKLTLNCPKRGYFRITSSELTTFSMLHRQRYSTSCPADTELYVYAARTDVGNILTTCERLMGNLQCAKRLFEDPFAFSSIREYTTNDPMNTINWKASARTGALMVNTFKSTLTRQVMIYLDIEDSGILKYDWLIEESISVAASLAHKLIGNGIDVGICVNTELDESMMYPEKNALYPSGQFPRVIYTKPACSTKHLTYIEQTLAKCKSDGNIIPFTKFFIPPDNARKGLPAHMESISFMPPADATLIFISKNVTLNQKVIEGLAHREKQIVWVIPYTRGETCDVKTQENIRLIKREVNI